MRKAALATLLFAAPLLAASAPAGADVIDRAALREVLRSQPRAATGAPLPLPLPEPSAAPAASAAASSETAEIARRAGRR